MIVKPLRITLGVALTCWYGGIEWQRLLGSLKHKKQRSEFADADRKRRVEMGKRTASDVTSKSNLVASCRMQGSLAMFRG